MEFFDQINLKAMNKLLSLTAAQRKLYDQAQKDGFNFEPGEIVTYSRQWSEQLSLQEYDRYLKGCSFGFNRETALQYAKYPDLSVTPLMFLTTVKHTEANDIALPLSPSIDGSSGSPEQSTEKDENSDISLEHFIDLGMDEELYWEYKHQWEGGFTPGEFLSWHQQGFSQQALKIQQSMNPDLDAGNSMMNPGAAKKAEASDVKKETQISTAKLPPATQQRLDRLLKELYEIFPDKIVRQLHLKHKNTGKRVTRMYRELNFPNSDSFLEAHGFSVEKQVGGRPEKDKDALINELKNRYEKKKKVSSVKDLSEDNPDLAGQIKTLSNLSPQIFGMSLSEYLAAQNILETDIEDIGRKKGSYKADLFKATFDELCKRYKGNPFSGPMNQLRLQNKDINWNWIVSYHRSEKPEVTLRQYLEEQGILTQETAASLSREDAERKIQDILNRLTAKYVGKSKKPITLKEVMLDNPDFKVAEFNKLLAVVYGADMTPHIFLKKRGLIETPPARRSVTQEMMNDHTQGKRGVSDPNSCLALNTAMPFDDSSRYQYQLPQTELYISDQSGVVEESKYAYQWTLKSVAFAPNIVVIREGAFEGCNSLETLMLPENLIDLGKRCFMYCETLSKIIIPASVRHIHEEAFYGCKNLKSVAVIGKDTKIHETAFLNCMMPVSDLLVYQKNDEL